jgi:hypothetical protein
MEPRTIRAFADSCRRLHEIYDLTTPPSKGIPREPRRTEVFDRIFVQALVPTSPNPETREELGTITQVYLGGGESDLPGRRLSICFGLGQSTELESIRLATHEVKILELEKRRDELGRSDFMLAPICDEKAIRLLPYGKEHDYRWQRDAAELLRSAAERPDPERVVFLEEQVTQAGEIKASVAVRLLLMDPIDTGTEPYLLCVLRDERVPLARRILADEAFWQRPDRPWSYSPERMALLMKWAGEVKSRDEAEGLADDLAMADRIAEEFWTSHPEPRKRALKLIDAVEAMQSNPNVSIRAKSEAVDGLGSSSACAARTATFEALARLFKNSPHDEVRSEAARELSHLVPYSREETAQIRELLKQRNNWQLEEAIKPPKKPRASP